MRVFLDAHVCLSYLLKPDSQSAVNQVVQMAFAIHFEVVICDPLLAEIERVVEKIPYIGARVSDESLAIFTARLVRIGRVVQLDDEMGLWDVRDLEDAYILETADQGGVDFVISGDRDLLDDRHKWPSIRIVSASEFIMGWRAG